MLKDLAMRIPAIRRIQHDRIRLRDELRVTIDSMADYKMRVESLESELSSARTSEGRFYFYNSTFDAINTIKNHAVSGLIPEGGYLINFLGVRIDTKFLPEVLSGRAGQLEGVPIPANWHADIAEWAAALRAVDLARDSFTMAELGCGWGCWMNNAGIAARNRGLQVQLVGVEGDKGHVAFAYEACAANGFSPDQVTIHHGIAAATPGVALFPRQDHAGVNWGLEPIFGASEYQRRKAIREGSHDELPMISMQDVIGEHQKLDLLHIDIQGSEAIVVKESINILTERVSFILIGTHSREIEGDLFKTFLSAGWWLEIERPAILDIRGGVPVVTVDGVQGWRNPRYA